MTLKIYEKTVLLLENPYCELYYIGMYGKSWGYTGYGIKDIEIL